MKTNNTINRIIDYFNHGDEVSVLYVFGSYGSRKETKESDIDIAVLIDKARLKKKNFTDLKKITIPLHQPSLCGLSTL